MTLDTFPTLLQITGLTKRFGGVPALDRVSFNVAEGLVTALIGPNGAGKTTLINCLSGVLESDVGSIFFQGVDITGLPAHQAARRGISRTFQNLRVFPRMSVLDNVLCGLTVQAGSSLLEAMLRTPDLRQDRKSVV